MSTVKCLVWDLDNTLWQGVLLEDGTVSIREEIRRVIVGLDQRGILQSVASRNDHDYAWGWLERLGVAEYMVLPQIGWGPKSNSVATIAQQLQFTHETIAYIDDTLLERAEVSFHLPDVRCYPAERATSLLELPEFSPAVVTDDSRQRRNKYKATVARQAARAQFAGADDDFLHSAEIEMFVGRADSSDLARVEELTIRTTQMNATGLHYSEEALCALLSDPPHEILMVGMTDKFGPHGTVGTILLTKLPMVWHLKQMAASCRVIVFGVYAVLLDWLTDQAAAAGVNLVADYRRTARNGMIEDAYRSAGFSRVPVDGEEALPAAEAAGLERLSLRTERRSPPTTMTVSAIDLNRPYADPVIWGHRP